MKQRVIARQLWECLWQDYLRRVEYARSYQQMITEAQGTVTNDHIAFRSLRLTFNSPKGKICLGIPYIACLAQVLGYLKAAEYEFPQKHLYACHYRHPQQDRLNLPKLFISELIVDELPSEIAEQIKMTVASGQFYTPQSIKSQIMASGTEAEIRQTVSFLQGIFTRPWNPPSIAVVKAVNEVSQYGAWVLLHGYSVNHFTGYINAQNTPQYPDIEATAAGLRQRGVPIKETIEGSREKGLRQKATQAVKEMVTVWDDETEQLIQVPWTYAYYEIAQRNAVATEIEQSVIFEGFLRSQADNFFEMTRSS